MVIKTSHTLRRITQHRFDQDQAKAYKHTPAQQGRVHGAEPDSTPALRQLQGCRRYLIQLGLCSAIPEPAESLLITEQTE